MTVPPADPGRDREHSLWLMPSGAVRQALEELIGNLSAEFSAPLFPPHITLLGGLVARDEELIAGAHQVATRLAPYSVQLGPIEYLDQYFRALFVHIRETPPVMHAHAVARQVFGRENDVYLPHLSLLYGDFTPGVKESIIERIGKRFDETFVAESIFLYTTYGETSTWRCLGEFPLGKNRPG